MYRFPLHDVVKEKRGGDYNSSPHIQKQQHGMVTIKNINVGMYVSDGSEVQLVTEVKRDRYGENMKDRPLYTIICKGITSGEKYNYRVNSEDEDISNKLEVVSGDDFRVESVFRKKRDKYIQEAYDALQRLENGSERLSREQPTFFSQDKVLSEVSDLIKKAYELFLKKS